MATPNYGSIPQQVLNEITLGIVQDTAGLADRVCRIRRDIETLKGEAPFLSSEATTRRRENRDLSPGARAKPANGGFGSVPYNCLRQTGLAEIYDESQISAAAYNLDLIAHWVQEAVKQTYTNTDAKLEEVLSSTTQNLEYDVTSDGSGSWLDLTNGAPLTDIINAARLVPGRDLVICGYDALIAIQNHPQSQGRLSGYESGTVSFINEAQVLIANAARVRPEQVILFVDEDAIFNEEAAGQGFSTEYVFTDGFWIGKRDDLQLFDPQHPENRKSEMDRTIEGAVTTLAHHRYVDIIRHVQQNAVTLTEILSE
jgi:hypothetical protein